MNANLIMVPIFIGEKLTRIILESRFTKFDLIRAHSRSFAVRFLKFCHRAAKMVIAKHPAACFFSRPVERLA